MRQSLCWKTHKPTGYKKSVRVCINCPFCLQRLWHVPFGVETGNAEPHAVCYIWAVRKHTATQK